MVKVPSPIRKKEQIEQELKKKHLLSDEDKKIMHKILCGCIRQKEDYLIQKSGHGSDPQDNGADIQDPLAEWKNNPRLSWEILKRSWKGRQGVDAGWSLGNQRIKTRKKKPPDKWF
jgi:hypothetical protein